MIYHCCDPRRRELVLDHPDLNGIDFVEVLDQEAPAGTPVQRTLLVRFLKPAPLLTPDQIEVVGGARITGITIDWITRADAPDLTLIDPLEVGLPGFLTALPDPDHVLAVRTSVSGDFSTYTLRLVDTLGALVPPTDIDRVLSEIGFSFKVECPTDFDCAPQLDCPPDALPEPEISYLAKDYTSFRRLMLNRMAQIMPDWRERNPADIGITLVELLSYTGDRLSYAQDAVATEAYLSTARRRSSVRRHARLVDYQMHDGGNARVWVHFDVSVPFVDLTEDDNSFLTRLPGYDVVIAPDQQTRALALEPLVFEPLYGKRLFQDHNALPFYEWGDGDCCLPKGATRATLAGDFPNLAIGDVLIFEEVLGPRTGRAADANPSHRHPVRLCAVQAGLSDDLTGTDITEIRWSEEDALPFALCLSATPDDAGDTGILTGISHALGNVVLADHGRQVAGEDLPAVPLPYLTLVPDDSGEPCDHPAPQPVPPRFNPVLNLGPVSQISPAYDPETATSARAATQQPLVARRPDVRLDVLVDPGDPPRPPWTVRRDLLQSFGDDLHFVVETERDGRARLRFGDDRNGRRPNSGTRLSASYRVGNGIVGNIGADALHHMFTPHGGIDSLRNPLPAFGGTEPEGIEETRQAAPYAYRRQERAVTPQDYADQAAKYPDVQRAAATFRWNGHGHTVFVTVDRFGGRPITPEFEAGLTAFLDRVRMAGYDLEIDAPRFVPIELGLFICAGPDHFRSEVRRDVLEVLGTGNLPGGRLGHFHPDNLSFGAPLYLSPVYAAVMAIEGVASAKATRFRRRGTTTTVPLQDGIITLGRLEIAQLENDPNFPERGAIEIEMGGGK